MTLVDAGPLVALINRGDSHHAECVEIAGRFRFLQMATTWPCFTETMYLLSSAGGVRFQEQLWRMRRAGKLALLDITPAEADRMEALMAQYADVPMDLADASLVAVAESRNIRRLFSIDSDFTIYRLSDGSTLDLVR